MRPRNVVKVGHALHSTVWGYSRKEPEKAKDVWSRMLALSLVLPLSRDARKRLQWFYDCAVKFNGNVRKTCRYFGIPRKTYYYWRKRFDITNPRTLEERSRRPKHGPLPVLRPEQTTRIFELRSEFPFYSKMKLAVLYKRRFGENVSTWQIQRVIERFQLYPDIKRARTIARKRKNAAHKQRIAKCDLKPFTGWLFSLDTVNISILGKRRFVFTAIDHHSRLLFTRAYLTPSSKSTADFMERLHDFADNRIQNVHTDNGGEFHNSFEQVLKRLRITHWWSRTHTPKDNAMNERVNRTIQEEFLPYYRYVEDLDQFNQGLVDWMQDYNWERPHAALGYKSPMDIVRLSPNPNPRFVPEWLEEGPLEAEEDL